MAENPKNIRARLFLADHYATLKRWRKVISTLEPQTETLPESHLVMLANSYVTIGDFSNAQLMAAHLVSRSTTKVDHQLSAVKIYSKIIDNLRNRSPLRKPLLEKVFNTLKAAKSINGKDSRIYDLWFETLEKYIPHYGSEAVRVLDDMQASGVVFKPKNYSQACRYNYMAEFTNAAKINCQKAILKDPENPANHIYLGQAYINTGETKKGTRMLASIGEKFSESEEALWTTGQSYYENEKFSEAYTFFKKATAHKDAKPRAFLGLANAAFTLRKYGEALEAFTQHCKRSKFLHQDFRKASGMLKNNPKWQRQYRFSMSDCND